MTGEGHRRIVEPRVPSRELGYLSELGYLRYDLFFPLDFVFYIAIDYSFHFHLCIFNWRRIALRC